MCNTLLQGGGINGGKKLIPYTFNIHPFFAIYMENYLSEKYLMCTHFEGEEDVRNYVLYTHLNVHNYGLSLRVFGIFTVYVMDHI